MKPATISPWSREQRCAGGVARIVRDGDWILRSVSGALDDESHVRMLADVVAALRRSERSSERSLVLVDLGRAGEPSRAAHAREQKHHDLHGRLFREHTAAIAFLVSCPLMPPPPPCRWRVFTDWTAAIVWLEQQARANHMRGLPQRLRSVLAREHGIEASPVTMGSRSFEAASSLED